MASLNGSLSRLPVILILPVARVRRPGDRPIPVSEKESPDSKGKALGNAQAERSDTSTTENRPPMAKATGSQSVAAAQVRVKRWGKSPPRWW